ncbi:hypothetical protein LWC34_50820 [Kibdelosporangium philippinense]|uniref:Uncharacterized protein n=1 Tax=Kibdelosporangium philippinense TaxID=211113 RepID=A0ABS8ZTL2_9PSEU|nr:hypothetical protein [Kibdelosporangium philippinense]MCE7011046.1 hypothetical protein [Kibdelosporangium philippinense]
MAIRQPPLPTTAVADGPARHALAAVQPVQYWASPPPQPPPPARSAVVAAVVITLFVILAPLAVFAELSTY